MVSKREALTEMEKLQGIRAKKKNQPKPSAPEFMIPREDVNRYKELQKAVDMAYKEVREDDP